MIKDLFKICECKCGHSISYEKSDVIHQDGFGIYDWNGEFPYYILRIDELTEFVRKMDKECTERIGYIPDIGVIQCPNCGKYIVVE